MRPPQLAIDAYIPYEGEPHQIVAIVGTAVTLVASDGTYKLVRTSELPAHVEVGAHEDPKPIKALARAAELAFLPASVRKKAEVLEDHILELETGFKAGYRASEDELPNPDYDPALPMSQREETKLAELAQAGFPMEAWKLRRLRSEYRKDGLRALYDKRLTRVAKPRRGNYDELVLAAIRAQALAERDEATGTAERFMRRLERRLGVMTAKRNEELRKDGKPEIEVPALPSESTVARLKNEIAPRTYLDASAKTRMSNASNPDDPFTPKIVTRPGEIVEIDTTPLDVLILDEKGREQGVDLTYSIDAMSKSLTAWRFAPANATDRVDAALLLAQMLVPEPMRPGWGQALSARYMLLPFDRRMSLEDRYEEAAARPVIFPETIQVDRGKVYLSRHFGEACVRFGISIMPARPGTGSDKPFVERGFNSIRTLFSQHVRGYTGSDTTQRGRDPKPYFTLEQLKELFDEWVIVGWQHRVYSGLTIPHFPGRELTPNLAYGFGVSMAGYVQCPVGTDAYVNLLPVVKRVLDRNGITIDRMRFTSPDLRRFLRLRSPLAGRNDIWPIHYDPHDMAQVYLQDPTDGSWWAIPYAFQSVVGQPFADFMFKAAVEAVKRAGEDLGNEKAIALALKALLDRADVGGADGRRARRSKVRATQAAADRAGFEPSAMASEAPKAKETLERRWRSGKVPTVGPEPAEHEYDPQADASPGFEPAEVGPGRSISNVIDDDDEGILL